MSPHLAMALVWLAAIGASAQPARGAEILPDQRILGLPLEFFGSSVAARDGLLVVGAPDAVGGEVTVYERADTEDRAWEEVALLTSVGTSDFGKAVAVEEGTIVVGSGSGGDPGNAHVFGPDGQGGWVEVVALDSPDGYLGFAEALSLHGDTLVVGAYRSNGAWIHQRDAGGPGAWGLVSQLVPDPFYLDDEFGASVDLDGDRVVVGAFESFPQGAVHVFERDAGGADAWDQVARVTADDPGHDFGRAAALSGDNLLVGASGSRGAAFMFERQGDGSWIEITAYRDFSGSGYARFGYSVALEGDLAVVGMPELVFDWLGAPARPEGEEDISGNAFVFGRDVGGPGEWGLLAELQMTDADPELDLGVAVAIDGDTLFVGDWGNTIEPPFTAGSVTIARHNDLVLAGAGDCPGEVTVSLVGATPGGSVLLLGGQQEGVFQVPAGNCAGRVVEIADPRPVGLAPAEPDGSLTLTFQSGPGVCGALAQGVDLATCRVSTLAALPPPPLPPGVDRLQAPDTGYGDQFGYDVAVDGDTLVVGARYAEAPWSRSGSVDVFARDPDDPDRWRHVADLIPPGISTNDEFGFDVALDGDLAIAGAPAADPLGSESGSAHLFEHLGGDDWLHVAELLPADGGEEERFGSAVAVSGDTVAVGAYFHDHAGDGSGAVYLFERDPGEASGWSQAAELLPPNDVTHWLGYSVALDGDRLVAGAYANNSELVVIYERPPGDPTAWEAVAIFDEEIGGLGWTVDIDGEVAVAGAPSDDIAGDFAGAAIVFERDDDGTWRAVQFLEPTGHGAEDRLGSAVAVSGDLIAVGSEQDGREPEAGAVHLFQRQGGGGWVEVGRVVAPDGESGDGFGESRSLALTAFDLIVGAPGDAQPGDLAGSVYTFARP